MSEKFFFLVYSEGKIKKNATLRVADHSFTDDQMRIWHIAGHTEVFLSSCAEAAKRLVDFVHSLLCRGQSYRPPVVTADISISCASCCVFLTIWGRHNIMVALILFHPLICHQRE